jgi:hypothetical protein
MTVVRQLDQPVQLLALLDCLALLVGAVISNNGVQRQAVTVDNRPTWVRDHTGGGVLLAGDVGGDAQVSESFSVRFHHHDRSGAMVTYCYYAALDLKDPTTILVERHIECLVCTDPNDPRGTKIWSTNRSIVFQGGFGDVQVATDAANYAAKRHLDCKEPWTGRSPWSNE